MTAIRFSIPIPIDHIEPRGEFQTIAALRELAAAIETSGASAAYLTDHPAPDAAWLHGDAAGHDTLDPFAALAFVAAATTRLKVMTQIVVLPYRNPFLAAKAAATLQILSGGRFIFGVGTGYLKGEFEALGVDVRKRGALMDEAVETIRMAWAGGPVVRRGLTFNAPGNEPRPIPSPPPPIWIGGGSDKAVERAARWGDGWTPFFSRPTSNPDLTAGAITSVPEMAAKIALLRAHRDRLGRTGPFDISLGIPFALEEHSAAQARKYRDTIEEFVAIGATWITIKPPMTSRAGFCEDMRWLGEEVIGRFVRPGE